MRLELTCVGLLVELANHYTTTGDKLVQREYKTRQNWVGKMIHWEMCKKLKFDHTNKWYMHNSAYLPGRMRHINFDIQVHY